MPEYICSWLLPYAFAQMKTNKRLTLERCHQRIAVEEFSSEDVVINLEYRRKQNHRNVKGNFRNRVVKCRFDPDSISFKSLKRGVYFIMNRTNRVTSKIVIDQSEVVHLLSQNFSSIWRWFLQSASVSLPLINATTMGRHDHRWTRAWEWRSKFGWSFIVPIWL